MTIKIASRSSKLALAQVDAFVTQFSISDYEIIKIKTEGDKKSAQGETLFDKAHFVSDVQKCLLNGEADIAVHSAKDTPAKELDSLIRYFLPSKSCEDVLIFREEVKFNDEMKLGTSSLRRQMQAKHHLNAKNIVNLSGNVDTRLEKLYRGEYDCIILAKAGLERLGMLDELQYEEMTWSTASGQGFLCIEHLNDLSTDIDHFLLHSLYIHHVVGGRLISIEREILETLNAGCNSAISIQTDIHPETYNKPPSKIKPGEPDFIHSGVIYGKEKYISFSGTTIEETINDIKKQDGIKLLNEHN